MAFVGEPPACWSLPPRRPFTYPIARCKPMNSAPPVTNATSGTQGGLPSSASGMSSRPTTASTIPGGKVKREAQRALGDMDELGEHTAGDVAGRRQRRQRENTQNVAVIRAARGCRG